MAGQYSSLGVLMMPESGSICVCWLTSLVPDRCTAGKSKGCCCSLFNIVRRPRKGFRFSDRILLYFAAVGVRASRVVAAARGVVSLTRSPESPDTAAASSIPKQPFAHLNAPANYCAWPATHRSVYFPNDLEIHSNGGTHS